MYVYIHIYIHATVARRHIILCSHTIELQRVRCRFVDDFFDAQIEDVRNELCVGLQVTAYFSIALPVTFQNERIDANLPHHLGRFGRSEIDAGSEAVDDRRRTPAGCIELVDDRWFPSKSVEVHPRGLVPFLRPKFQSERIEKRLPRPNGMDGDGPFQFHRHAQLELECLDLFLHRSYQGAGDRIVPCAVQTNLPDCGGWVIHEELPHESLPPKFAPAHGTADAGICLGIVIGKVEEPRMDPERRHERMPSLTTGQLFELPAKDSDWKKISRLSGHDRTSAH